MLLEKNKHANPLRSSPFYSQPDQRLVIVLCALKMRSPDSVKPREGVVYFNYKVYSFANRSPLYAVRMNDFVERWENFYFESPPPARQTQFQAPKNTQTLINYDIILGCWWGNIYRQQRGRSLSGSVYMENRYPWMWSGARILLLERVAIVALRSAIFPRGFSP